PLNISKAVNLTNDGVGEAGMAVPHIPNQLAVGVSITANAGDVVSLRGLVIDGVHSGDTGLTFLSGGGLHIQDCVARNFTSGTGMMAVPNTHSKLFVSDTLVSSNNSGPGFDAQSAGIFIAAGGPGGSVDAVLNRVRVENNDNGLYVSGSQGFVDGNGPSHVILRNSVIAGNAFNGIWAIT